MIELIKTKYDLCTGCNRCVRECPMETANITWQDENGDIKVRIDYDKCINCGRCISACKHDARYLVDDTERFFEDLQNGVPITVMAAPAISTNIPEYKRLFTWLKQLGVKQLFDVSLGADISIWGHVRYLEKTNFAPIITQPCPVIVMYLEMYRQDLLDRLSPIHGPMGSASAYMRKYLGVTDRIAALSPCVAKSIEFHDTDMAQYNITFTRLLDYMKENDITLPDEETGFDHHESGLGTIFPVPGGLKENIEFFMGKKLHIAKAEGFNVYEKLDKYAGTPDDFLPEVFDVLNCIEGCNVGPASSHEQSVFEIDKTMNDRRVRAMQEERREEYEKIYKSYDEMFDLKDFMRVYRPVSTPFPQINNADIAKAFEQLGKSDYEKQNVDCGACGSETCHQMARKIALGVNIPINCIVKTMEDAKAEHETNLLVNEQLSELEKMHEADERMRTMLDINPQINVLFDSRFRVIDCNPTAVTFMGFDSKEDFLKGFDASMTSSIPETQPDGRPSSSFVDKFAEAAEVGHVRFETELLIKGEKKSLDVELRRIPHEDSFAIVCYVFDITGMREREVELLHAHEQNVLQLAKLNLVITATKIGLWDMTVNIDDPLNPDNPIIWADEVRQMLGYKDESDFPNKLSSMNDRLHPDDFENTTNAYASHMLDRTGMTPYDVEYRIMKKDGDYAYIHASGETIRDADGNPLHVSGAMVDITETKNILRDTERQRIEAEAANKAKTSFLSTMSHEIRTPMNAILGITEIQLHNDLLDQNAKEAFNKIYTSSDLLLSIINDILDLSKIEAGKLELLEAKYEIASLISDTVQLNMMRVGSKPIDFKLETDANMPAVFLGDELRIKQILNNLLSNAFKYTMEGEVGLSISSEPTDDDDKVILVVKVSDTGQGMTEAQVKSLFEEYARFNLEANRATEGTGLGMSITNNLISLMGGEITVESEPGKGSVFTVRLPQKMVGEETLGKEISDSLEQFRSSSRAQMKRVRITREPMPYGSVLIVDDVDTNIYVASGLLTPYELMIDSADSGYAAIDKIIEGKEYDIIFMDHMMPKMDGIETTKTIREMGYKKPIVALTANAVSGQANVFLQNGFDGFISKPIDIRQLNTVLNTMIRDKQPPEVLAIYKNKGRQANELAPECPEGPECPECPGYAAAPEFTVDPRFAEFFVRDATKALAILDPICQDKNYQDEEAMRAYTINVHGMKSALANVGHKELAAVAAELEMACRAGSIGVLESETPVFLEALRGFTNALKPKEEPETTGSDEDKAYLSEKLLAIKTACEEYDEKAAGEALEALRQKPWSHGTKEILDEISELLLHSEFDEIVELTGKNIQ